MRDAQVMEVGRESASDVDEVALLDAARDGDDAAIAELWVRFYEPLCAWARRVTDRFEPEDLASEAFVQMLNALRKGGGPVSSPGAYLRLTVRNLSIRKTETALTTTSICEVADHGVDCAAIEQVLVDADNQPMREAFHTLPERWQLVLSLLVIQEYSITDAADMLGLSHNSTSALRWRAVRGLERAYRLARTAPDAAPVGEPGRTTSTTAA